MIRSELVQMLADENPDLAFSAVERTIDLFFCEIIDALSRGSRVELRRFGVFTARARNARLGRNPRTGEPIDVPARKIPFFKPGKDLSARVNANNLPLHDPAVERRLTDQRARYATCRVTGVRKSTEARKAVSAASASIPQRLPRQTHAGGSDA